MGLFLVLKEVQKSKQIRHDKNPPPQLRKNCFTRKRQCLRTLFIDSGKRQTHFSRYRNRAFRHSKPGRKNRPTTYRYGGLSF